MNGFCVFTSKFGDKKKNNLRLMSDVQIPRGNNIIMGHVLANDGGIYQTLKV